MTMPVPSLNWLRVFEAAARCESFARAAQELGMSPAGVSQQVRALEERLGAQLFERHAHAVTLTTIGRAYLPGVQQALMTLQSTTEGLFGAARQQPLYVQAILLFSHGILSRGYGAFTSAHPDVTLTLRSANEIYDFRQGFSDLQVVFGTPRAHSSQSDKLLGERLYPVARPEIAGAITSPEDLFDHALIEVSTHRGGWPFVLDQAGVTTARARYLFVDNSIMAMALAREGLGIALARAPASDKAVEEAGLVPCLPQIMTRGAESYHLVYPERTALRAPARAFRDWLVGYCESLEKASML